jgi:hypothetical protein
VRNGFELSGKYSGVAQDRTACKADSRFHSGFTWISVGLTRIARRTKSALHAWPFDRVALPESSLKTGVFMNVTLSLGPLVSLIAGILILIMPRLLNYIVALYLIIIGLIGIFGVGTKHF